MKALRILLLLAALAASGCSIKIYTYHIQQAPDSEMLVEIKIDKVFEADGKGVLDLGVLP